MSWDGASAFFAMGGYGLYVWGAYGVTAVLMLIDPIAAIRRHRRALQVSIDGEPDEPSRARPDRERVTA